MSSTSHPSQPASQPAIWDHIGRESMLARLAGDEDLFRELVGLFLEDYPPLMQKLEAALSRHDFEEAERAGHSLKGLTANLGATAAAQAAGLIEAGARHRDEPQMVAGADSLRLEMTPLAAALKQYRA